MAMPKLSLEDAGSTRSVAKACHDPGNGGVGAGAGRDGEANAPSSRSLPAQDTRRGSDNFGGFGPSSSSPSHRPSLGSNPSPRALLSPRVLPSKMVGVWSVSERDDALTPFETGSNDDVRTPPTGLSPPGKGLEGAGGSNEGGKFLPQGELGSGVETGEIERAGAAGGVENMDYTFVSCLEDGERAADLSLDLSSGAGFGGVGLGTMERVLEERKGREERHAVIERNNLLERLKAMEAEREEERRASRRELEDVMEQKAKLEGAVEELRSERDALLERLRIVEGAKGGLRVEGCEADEEEIGRLRGERDAEMRKRVSAEEELGRARGERDAEVERCKAAEEELTKIREEFERVRAETDAKVVKLEKWAEGMSGLGGEGRGIGEIGGGVPA